MNIRSLEKLLKYKGIYMALFSIESDPIGSTLLVLLVLGISTVILTYLIWIGITIPKQITTRELTSLISIFAHKRSPHKSNKKGRSLIYDNSLLPPSYLH